jgi:hypothetical protein
MNEWTPTLKADKDNPNRLYRVVMDSAERAKQSTGRAMKNRESARREMYHAAVHWQYLARYHTDWLQSQVRYTEGGRDTLLESIFDSLPVFGEHYSDLFRAIDDGMTLEEYLNTSARTFSVKIKAKKAQAKVSLPPPPEARRLPAMTDEEYDAKREEELQSLRLRVKAIPEMQRAMARLERRVEELEATLNRIYKASAKPLAKPLAIAS